MASNVFVRGISSLSSSHSTRGTSSRPGSSAGGYLAIAGAGGHVSRGASRLVAAHRISDISEGGMHLPDGLFGSEVDGDLSPITPARPSGACGGDLLGEPLMVRVLLALGV